MLDCLNTPYPHLQATLNSGILTLAINRPEAKNALYGDLYRQLEQALYQADANPAVQVVIVRGANQDFSAGNDLQDFAKSMQTPTYPAGSNPPFLLLKSAARFSKPLIIAVKGVAIGIGTTLLLHADFVYSHEQALFQMPFLSLGLSPEGASSQLLQQRAGYLLAADLLLAARRFNAHTAKNAGLVTQIVDDPYLTAEQTAQHLLTLPTTALKQSKALMKDVEGIVALIDREAELFMQRVKSAELHEALLAFKEKRKPNFTPFNQ